MSLKKEIYDAIKQNMREKNNEALLALRQIKSEILKIESTGKDKEASDEEIQKVLKSLAKQHVESIDIYKSNGREEALKQEELELEIIKGFLPEELDTEVLKTLVENAIKETSASSMKDMGAVMKHIRAEIEKKGASVDGKVLSDLVKQGLSS